MSMATKRDADTNSSAPSAKFLQARITALTTSCIKRLENIFAAALDDDHSTYNAPPSTTDAKPPPILAETAVKHLQLDVESAALIRAAEEFMVLTRTLKELWLFGGLDTISETNKQDIELQQQMEADEKLVVDGFLKMLATSNMTKDSTTNGMHDDHQPDD